MVFDSNAAVAGVANLLYSLVARDIARTRSTRLEKIERMHEILRELER